MQDLSGTFWIGMGDNGIVCLEDGKFKRIKTNTLLDNVPTWSMYVAHDSTILFGTEHGVVSFHKGVFAESHNKDLASAKINRIIRDREGNIWFASDRNGIGKLTHGKFQVTKLETTVNAIAEDNVGRMWIATDKGVRCFVGEKEIKNKLTEFTKDLRIRHVGITFKSEVMATCYTKPGFVLYNPRAATIRTWTTDEGLAGNKVRVAIETAPGEYYVGTTPRQSP